MLKRKLKQYSDIFKDLLEGTQLETVSKEEIIAQDKNGKKLTFSSFGKYLNFHYHSDNIERHGVLILPEKENMERTKVRETRLEKREQGCLVEQKERIYHTDPFSANHILTHYTVRRYALDKSLELLPSLSMEFLEENSKMETTFESFVQVEYRGTYETLLTSTPAVSTVVKVNKKDISHLYDIANGRDKLSRIYDLCQGKITKNNHDDAEEMALGLTDSSGLNYLKNSGIKAKEEAICGPCRKEQKGKSLYLHIK